jgi:predicted double-glycine peptidase
MFRTDREVGHSHTERTQFEEFQKRILKRTFRSQTEEVAEAKIFVGKMTLHISHQIFMVIKYGEHVARITEVEKKYIEF